MRRGQFQRRTRADGTEEWGYQYTDPTDGRRKWFWGTAARVQILKRQIEQARQELRHQMVSREVVRATLPGHADPHHVRMADVFERYLLTLPKRARKTAESTWKHVINTGGLGKLVAYDLTAEVMGRWLVGLQSDGGRGGNGRAPKSIQGAYLYIAAACRKVLGMQRLPWGDWRPYRYSKVPPRTPRAAVRSFEDLVSIVKEARKADARAWGRGAYADHSIAIVVAGLTAMRNAELAGLGWEDVQIDQEPFTITIRYQAPRGWQTENPKATRPTVPPKNGHVHFQVLHISVAAALAEQRNQLRTLGWYREDGPVFPAKRDRGRLGRWRTSGRVLDPRTVRAVVGRAGIPNAHRWCTHSLRHSAASLEAVAQHGDLQATAARTGHRDIRTLQGYLHQMGVGAPRSRLPEIPAAAFTTAVDTSGAAALPPSLPERSADDPWGLAVPPGDLALTWSSELEAKAARDKEERRRERKQAERPFDELAREWLDQIEKAPRGIVRDLSGKPLPRPKAVTDAARRAGANGYQRAKYAARPVEECRGCWKRGKIAVLARWAQVLERERKKRAAQRGALPHELG